jgi:hypothetical protein
MSRKGSEGKIKFFHGSWLALLVESQNDVRDPAGLFFFFFHEMPASRKGDVRSSGEWLKTGGTRSQISVSCADPGVSGFG